MILLLLAALQAPPAAAPPTTVSSSAGELRIERLATLEFPWGVAALPDGRLLITEKPGRLRIFANGRLSGPVANVPRVVYRGEKDQGGLLDVALDPDFASNQLIYLSFVEADPGQPRGERETGDRRFLTYLDTTDNIVRGGAVARARLVRSRLEDVRIIWRQEPKQVGRGHFGHRLAFGPDGKLYITSGDRMRFDPAQDLTSNVGKIVRINGDGSLPVDNPFAGRDGSRGDIWSYGHRNVLAAAFEPSGSLWVIEMGPKGGDELNRVERGANYGWPLVSNGDNYDDSAIPDHPTRPELQAPVHTWTPVVSASGALFYTGELFPGWRGSMIAGGLSSQALLRLTMRGTEPPAEERIAVGRRIRDVAQLPDGALVVIVDDRRGELLRIAPAGADARATGGHR